ncbi:hypothetical protein D3C73_808590 [compost metagenome]
MQPAAIGQAQLQGELTHGGAGAEERADPGFFPLVIAQGQVEQVQLDLAGGFLVDDIAQQVFGGGILAVERRAFTGRILLDAQEKVRGVQALDQLRRPLRVAGPDAHDVGQTAGDQAGGNLQHLAVAHVIPDAAGQHLRREHAGHQDEHQPPVEGAWQQVHDSLATVAQVSM